MPIWSEILREIQLTPLDDGSPDLDQVRRKYLAELHRNSGNAVILYATAWTQKPNAPVELVSISEEDIQALMEVSNGLQGDGLDLILHSPGGSPESTEAIVSYLRSRFGFIRVIVPDLAMSAATMLACAADEIAMGKHSFLGPIDPQLILPTSLGVRQIAAQDLLDQFELAKQECQDPAKLSAWLPILNQFGPDLLIKCDTVMEMTTNLVETWLANYMFKNEEDGQQHAKSVAEWLSDHNLLKSHSRHIARDQIESHGLVVKKLEDDPTFQDAALSVFHATTHTFGLSPTVKIVENHLGRAFIKNNIVFDQPPT